SEPSTPGETEPSKPVIPSSPDETEPSEPVVDKGILGDVDGNGKVNIKDATAIQKRLANIT
ncbi:MAG: hypothetical protein IJ451_03220, partial [Ruminococcus sp.]|nr:hypothetical protein [Ruminococcus sp.]